MKKKENYYYECKYCREILNENEIEFNGYGWSGKTCKKCGVGEVVKIIKPNN